MDMNRARCMSYNACGGRADKVVAEIRSVGSNHDTVKTMFDGIIDNLTMGFTANDICGNTVKMRRFLLQYLGGLIQTLLDDIFTNIGGDGPLRHLEYMQGDDRTSRRQKRPGDL